MGGYLTTTSAQQKEMLEAIGMHSLEDLYAAAPAELMLPDGPAIPAGQSELAVLRQLEKMAAMNEVFPSVFRGMGAYRHYIPSIVSTVASKETFLTAYTPYQAELSQGVLQSIFEYQTMVCELTGMDASNASVYDGASAAAEAVAMCRDRKGGKTLVSAAVHPDVLQTIRTYCWAQNAEVAVVPEKDGHTDLVALSAMLDDTVAGVYIQQPNVYGLVEDAAEIGEAVHSAGAKYIMGVNPIAMALLQTPGECGADIAVGEGQPLGIPLSWGGPYLGFMAAKKDMVRKLPGRICGETSDGQGRRAFVLTLQAREQHIRREKASSKICSNQALCAMTAAVYMAAMGPGGMGEVARQCTAKAHYLAQELGKVKGFTLVHEGEFFHEFLTECPVPAEVLMARLEEEGVLGGAPIEKGILWCATEMNTKEEMDRLVQIAKEVAGE